MSVHGTLRFSACAAKSVAIRASRSWPASYRLDPDANDPQRTSDQSGVISLNFDANDSDQPSKSGDRHERESYFEKLSSVKI
jgi:hypothetical protein